MLIISLISLQIVLRNLAFLNLGYDFMSCWLTDLLTVVANDIISWVSLGVFNGAVFFDTAKVLKVKFGMLAFRNKSIKNFLLSYSTLFLHLSVIGWFMFFFFWGAGRYSSHNSLIDARVPQGLTPDPFFFYCTSVIYLGMSKILGRELTCSF